MTEVKSHDVQSSSYLCLAYLLWCASGLSNGLRFVSCGIFHSFCPLKRRSLLHRYKHDLHIDTCKTAGQADSCSQSYHCIFLFTRMKSILGLSITHFTAHTMEISSSLDRRCLQFFPSNPFLGSYVQLFYCSASPTASSFFWISQGSLVRRPTLSDVSRHCANKKSILIDSGAKKKALVLNTVYALWK